MGKVLGRGRRVGARVNEGIILATENVLSNAKHDWVQPRIGCTVKKIPTIILQQKAITTFLADSEDKVKVLSARGRGFALTYKGGIAKKLPWKSAKSFSNRPCRVNSSNWWNSKKRSTVMIRRQGAVAGLTGKPNAL
jgi:hypothetical protein